MLTPREIIAQAWAVTTTEPLLKRWGFFGAFFEILLDIKLVIYQMYFLYSYVQGAEAGFFDIEVMLYNSMPFWLFITITLLFCLLIFVELFIPSFASGAIIGLTAKSHNKEKVQGGFILAMYNFFPILAVHEVFIFSSISIYVTSISLIVRYAGGLSSMMIFVATLVWIISNIMKFFSSFTESGIVVEKLGVFESGAKSVKLIMSYMPHVMFLTMLLLVISIRIIINTFVIILVPLIILGSSLLLTYYVQPVLSFAIAGVIGLLLTVVAAYFLAYLHVFKQAVWTIMYLELIQEKELDKIG